MITHWSQGQQDTAEAQAVLGSLLQGTVNICNDYRDDDYDDYGDYDDDDDDYDGDDDLNYDRDRNSRRVEKFASETLPIWRRHFTERSWWWYHGWKKVGTLEYFLSQNWEEYFEARLEYWRERERKGAVMTILTVEKSG